jgi:glutamate synthase domain-containing protein 1
MQRYPLYDTLQHHDACGVGFIADRSATASHRIVRLGVDCLHNLDHRGARSADGTGDGAGVMTRIPYRMIERDLATAGKPVPERDRLGVVNAFLPLAASAQARELVESCLSDHRIGVLMWRIVPTDAHVLSETAKRTMPMIEQAIVTVPDSVEGTEDF